MKRLDLGDHRDSVRKHFIPETIIDPMVSAVYEQTSKKAIGLMYDMREQVLAATYGPQVAAPLAVERAVWWDWVIQ